MPAGEPASNRDTEISTAQCQYSSLWTLHQSAVTRLSYSCYHFNSRQQLPNQYAYHQHDLSAQVVLDEGIARQGSCKAANRTEFMLHVERPHRLEDASRETHLKGAS